ncbi:MAG: hypothetical protein AB9819_06940 [Methanomassiliicoccales archaeon]
MVGKGPLCQTCGAPIRKDYEYCNVCGKRTTTPEARRAAPVSPPKVLPVQRTKQRKKTKDADNVIPRRELVIALLAMTCMAPFCTWLSSLGGLIGISAAFNEAFYGRYVVLLAALGLLTIMAGDLVPAKVSRKAVIAAVGVGTMALTALDYVEIMRYNLSPESFLRAIPGIGMYLAFALGAALALAVLVPKRKRSPFTTDRPILRPGSRGSDP